MNTLTGINTPPNSLASESIDSFDYQLNQITRVNPVALAIQEELGEILKPTHAFLREHILESNKLAVFYEEIGNRAPTNIERRQIRSTLHAIYKGQLRNTKRYGNPNWRSETTEALERLVLAFYRKPEHAHVRLGTFISRLKRFTEITTKQLSQEFEIIKSCSMNTIKKYITCTLPDTATARGRNGSKEYMTLYQFFDQAF
ncbi:hypothetical protein [Vibrio mediterranei]|uniref:hypothetical protein n=1 Tax=Vibrio mediterranei TaxID=689 RepID=UPI004069252F